MKPNDPRIQTAVLQWAVDYGLDWVSVPDKPYCLQRATTSRLNSLEGYGFWGNFGTGNYINHNEFSMTGIIGQKIDKPMIVIVEHDWYAALSSGINFNDGDTLPPAPCTVYEFRVDNKHVILSLRTKEAELKCILDHHLMNNHVLDTAEWYGNCYVEISPNVWVGFGAFCSITKQAEGVTCQELKNWLMGQVRALNISLDTEIAETSVIRAPHKLNVSRIAKGKLPLSDFHIINLAKRHRYPSRDEASGDGNGKRLHFVRGHWRHFADFKTRVKWHLRGNPDLGWIDKHYTA